LIDDLQDEIDDDSKMSVIAPESIQGYILQGCQRVASLFPVAQKTDLRLVYGQSKYYFADSTVPVTGTGTAGYANLSITGTTSTGTGTISSSGKDITGAATAFLTELSVGQMIIVGTQKKMVVSIASNSVCTIEGAFDTNLSASAFDYCLTKFTKEINPGSTIVINSITRVVDTITDAYNMTVTQAFSGSETLEPFTIDTVVTEIPTKFYNLFEINRVEGIVNRGVEIVSNQMMLQRKQHEWISIAYSNYDQPLIASVWQDAHKYLEFYPTVQTDKTISIYGYIQVSPRAYSSDALTSNIPLPQEFEPAIKEFAKYRIFKRLKDEKQSKEAFDLFNYYISSLIREMPTKQRVTVSGN
jgi:hypothetical protein